MPLDYEVRSALTIPDDAFNEDGIATILVTGRSYRGVWVLNALTVRDGRPSGEPIGSIKTAPDGRPSMAVDTAMTWVGDACARAGLKLAHWESRNGAYGPDEAPFFASAIFTVDRCPSTP